MKHKVSKLKIKSGKDANKMLIRKLVRNFADHGSLKTTETKAKYLKSKLESLVHKTLSYNEAVKNELLPFFITEKEVLAFVETAKKHAKNQTGSGSIKIVKYGERFGDAASIVEVVWTHSEAPEEKKQKNNKTVKQKEEVKKVEEVKEEASTKEEK
ncbi:MAG: L17 family ribosomal protein [Patescibacteria group bacterium]